VPPACRAAGSDRGKDRPLPAMLVPCTSPGLRSACYACPGRDEH